MNWYLKVVRDNYANFSGRARRQEYWMFFLINVLITIGLSVVDGILGFGVGTFGLLSMLYGLAVLIPGLAVGVRRLHDTGRSGWWILIALIPLLGAIVLIIFLVMDSEPGSNQYGPNPKGAAPPAAGGTTMGGSAPGGMSNPGMGSMNPNRPM